MTRVGRTYRTHRLLRLYTVCIPWYSRKFIIRAEEEGLLGVAAGADGTVGAGDGWRCTLLQCGLLGVLLVGWGEVVDGVLDHVARVHGLLQAAGDALHRGTAACRRQT
ncbi:hypothetical protein INR49_003850 [Caranx melampygus]|nr:hypothetical protein INR49_003850 [Caranx melampygus]